MYHSVTTRSKNQMAEISASGIARERTAWLPDHGYSICGILQQFGSAVILYNHLS